MSIVNPITLSIARTFRLLKGTLASSPSKVLIKKPIFKIEMLEIKEIPMFFICSFFLINMSAKKKMPPYVKKEIKEFEPPPSPKKLFKGFKDKKIVEIEANKRKSRMLKEINLFFNLSFPSLISPTIPKIAIMLKEESKNIVLFASNGTVELGI